MRAAEIGRGGTLVVTNAHVQLPGGRQYREGDAVAAGHPDAAELQHLGVVSDVGRMAQVGTVSVPLPGGRRVEHAVFDDADDSRLGGGRAAA